MRYPIRINLDFIESWLSTVEVKNEKQRQFVESTRKACCELRNKGDLIVDLDVEEDVVLCRYVSGNEVVATVNEIQLFYAQYMARGEYDWDSYG